MRGNFTAGRRNFLTNAVTAAGSILSTGLCLAQGREDEARLQTSAPPLSFDNL